MKNEIVIYQPDKLTARVEVRIEEETVWLNKEQKSLLPGKDKIINKC